MDRKLLLLPLLLLLPGLYGCKHALLKKPRVAAFNEGYVGRRFKALNDINFWENGTVDPTHNIFKKGAILKVRLESGDEWIRVRALDVSKNEEQDPGEVIIFYVSDPQSGITGEQALKEIDGYLKSILSPVP